MTIIPETMNLTVVELIQMNLDPPNMALELTAMGLTESFGASCLIGVGSLARRSNSACRYLARKTPAESYTC